MALDNKRILTDLVEVYYVDRFVFPEPGRYIITSHDDMFIASCRSFESHVSAKTFAELLDEIDADLRETITAYGSARNRTKYQQSILRKMFGSDEDVYELCTTQILANDDE